MSTQSSTSPVAETALVARHWRWPVAGAAVLLVLFIWLFGDWLRSQGIHIRHETEDWGHTAVVPFISAYFIYLQRAKILAKPFKTAWSALLPIVLGVGMYVATTIGPMSIRHFNLEGFGLWLTLFGLILLFCGWRAMKFLWFPLVYLLVFGQKISPGLIQNITFWMQDVTARGSHIVLNLMIDVDRNGNTIYIYDNGVSKPLNIAEACSGMRMLMAFLALGVAMAYTGFKRFWQRAALVAMALPTSLLVNVLRVVTLGLLSLADINFATGEFHELIGLIWLFPAFLIYLGLMWVIRHVVIEGHDEARAAEGPLPAPKFDSKSKPAFAVACVVLLASGTGFEWLINEWNVYLRKLPVEMRGSFDTLPRQLGRWRANGLDKALDAAIIEELGTRKYLDRLYAIEGAPQEGALGVHLAYYTGMIDAVPHVPDRCFVAAGFNLKSLPANLPLQIDRQGWQIDPEHVNLRKNEPYLLADVTDLFTGNYRRVRMPVGDFAIRTSEFEHPENPNLRIFAGYFFIANGRVAVTPNDVKAIAFEKSEQYAYYCKLQFTYAANDATQQRFTELVAELMKDLLPQVMDRLPDWAEVERRGDAESKPAAQAQGS